MKQEQEKSIHWADFTADRIIKENPDKTRFVVASGITPSGVVHFGNFREAITVDMVARALRLKGKEVRFLFSWDDYDTFRKIPANMPRQDVLEKFLFQPIVDTPDPFGKCDSYATHHKENFQNELARVGLNVEYISQSKMYRSGIYAENIKQVLRKKDVIVYILNQYRTTPLDDDWMPVSIYCQKCNRDKIKSITFDGNDSLSYECDLCGHEGTEQISLSKRIKLPWRIDWPMRWAFEGVDFEPGGKDHSSEGGSYTTAKEIVVQVFDKKPPTYLQYDFVSIKGAGGKMSSSSGNVITVSDVLNIYEPEMVRWIFASYKSNVDFSVSFDLDVVKTYEDYDRQERIAYGAEAGNEKKVAMAKRVMELSQIEDTPEQLPIQPSFRHLCNILQINNGNIEHARQAYADQIKTARDERRFVQRSGCALFWLNNYAPEDFKFQVNASRPSLDLNDKQQNFLIKVRNFVDTSWEELSCDKDLHQKLYEFIHESEIEATEAFTTLYQILISKEKGPKLAGFIRTIGREKVLNLLKQ